VEVVGVGQQNGDAQIFGQVALGQAFDCGLRADGHEYRRFDDAVRRMEQSGAGAGVRAFGDDFEGDLGQLRAYAPMITRWGGRLGGGRGGPRCDAKRRIAGTFPGVSWPRWAQGLGGGMHLSDSRLALGRAESGSTGLEMVENQGEKKVESA